MSDLINRQDIRYDSMLRPLGNGNYEECEVAYRDEIEAMPSAQPERKWISCSERLPEDYEDVLAYFEYYRYGDYNCMFSTYGIGSYSSEYDSWLVNGETGWRKLHVFAWMPLPEPYKGE